MNTFVDLGHQYELLEVVFRIWSIDLEGNNQRIRDGVISLLLDGEPEQALEKAGELSENRMKRKVKKFIDLFSIIQSVSVPSISASSLYIGESYSFARWFTELDMNESQHLLQKEIITLVLEGSPVQAKWRAKDLECNQKREVEEYIQILHIIW